MSGDINETNPVEEYRGSQNTIKLDIYQTIGFKCHFPNKDQYPFGIDKCSLYIYYQNNDNLLATFNPVQLGTNTFSKHQRLCFNFLLCLQSLFPTVLQHAAIQHIF